MANSRREKPSFKVGDRVRLTGKFLRSTGQYTGQDAHSKWTVVSIKGDFIGVDEPKDDLSYWTPDEIKQMEVTWQGKTFVPRKINAHNLVLADKPDYSNL